MYLYCIGLGIRKKNFNNIHPSTEFYLTAEFQLSIFTKISYRMVKISYRMVKISYRMVKISYRMIKYHTEWFHISYFNII